MNRFTLLILSVGCLIVASTDAERPALTVLCEEAAMSAQDCLSRDAVEENKYPAILTMVARLLEDVFFCKGITDLSSECTLVGNAMQRKCDSQEKSIRYLNGLCLLVDWGLANKPCNNGTTEGTSSLRIADIPALDRSINMETLQSMLREVTCDQLSSFKNECTEGYAALGRCAFQTLN